VGSFFRKKLKTLEVSVLNFHVLPNDLDVYGHMNNGRYLTIMDLGRIDLLLRSEIGQYALKRKWNPIIASSMMRYRRSLKVFQSYQLKTRIVAWDDKWFYIEQIFKRNEQEIATGFVKGLFVSAKGKVSTDLIFQGVSVAVQSPEIPKQILEWQKADYWERSTD
jgi:acyl-CoA thioesterase FadM